ncbi:MAG: PucR family transcriptional regulator ligand-binding domain-containing protein, partial [Firmicutes bacterium]|nr:PucR family transcriptional regulator ligand-binding domain-containing protein [Bacillota bacterium]
MSVTVRDIMKLPCMKDAEIIAGEGGLDNLVTAVSVLEYSSYSDIQEKVFYEQEYEGSDIVITAFASIADSQENILSEIKDSYDIGEAGVIIYYFDLFVKELSPEVVDYANEVGYPIIIMPRDQFQLRYSEAISEISELLLEDRNKTDNFAATIMERFVSLPKNQQNATTLLRLLSSYLHLTLILADSNWKLTAFAGRPSILERVAEEHLKKILEGTFDGPCNVVTLEDVPGDKMELVVIGNDTIRKNILEQITDVVRLYLKMSANEVTDDIGTIQLIRAIIGDEPVKMRRLARNRGIDAGKLRNMIIFREPRFNMIKGETILGEIKDLLGRYCHDFVTDIYSGDAVAFMDDGLSSQWLPALRMLNDSLKDKGLDPICIYAR